MKFFNRDKKPTPAIPADLQPYYAPQDTGIRSWIAPVLRIVALVAVLALLVWGGIWVFNKIAGDDNKTDSEKNNTGSSMNINQETEAEAKKAEAERKAEAVANAEAAKKAEADKKKQAATPTPTPKPTATATPTPAPVAGTTETLPNSGPGDIFILFAVVAAFGAVLHRVYLTRSLKV